MLYLFLVLICVTRPCMLRRDISRRFIIIIFFLNLADQHKACRQLKIKQEMTAVGDQSVAVNVLRKETVFPR